MSYFVGKLAAGYLSAKLVNSGHLKPEDVTQIQLAVAATVGGGLEMLHDWVKLKYPNATWL